ncbi:hypothetical protein, partial [Klebsiella pneumoniae]|uniref:hypothetical protein n=1 Tax=Klebsiella pneumoniae TaxID=573 RepID=UPI003AF7DA39
MELVSDTTVGATPDEEGYCAGSKTYTVDLGDALTTQPGLTFHQNVQFVFRKEIPRYTYFNGRITMIGDFPYLGTYEN